MDSISSVLRRAKDLIDIPLKWCKGNYFMKYFDPESQTIVEKFCMLGAIQEVSKDHFQRMTVNHLVGILGYCSIPRYNDDVDTRHADVMRQMNRAIETAERMERKEEALLAPEPIPAMIPAPTAKALVKE